MHRIIAVAGDCGSPDTPSLANGNAQAVSQYDVACSQVSQHWRCDQFTKRPPGAPNVGRLPEVIRMLGLLLTSSSGICI
jgi:hypothetical protein